MMAAPMVAPVFPQTQSFYGQPPSAGAPAYGMRPTSSMYVHSVCLWLWLRVVAWLCGCVAVCSSGGTQGSGAVACGVTSYVGVLLCRYGAPPAGGQVYPQSARSSSALQSAGQSAFRTSSFSAAGDRGMHRTPSAGGRPAEGEASAWSAVC